MSSIGIGATNTSFPGSAATTVTLTKPASLALGDYLLVCINSYQGGAGGGVGITPPAGWATVDSNAGGIGDTNLFVFGKVADANDVAASSFVFSLSGSFFVCGGITRFTGVDTTTPAIVHHSTAFTTTTTPGDAGITAGIQPMLIIAIGHVDSVSRTVSGYQVVNTNPVWTEEYDGGTNSCFIAMAHAPYTLATATGAAQATLSGAALDGVFALIALQPQRVYPVVVVAASAVLTPILQKKIVATVIAAASAIITPTVSVTLKRWANQAKSALASFTDTKKS